MTTHHTSLAASPRRTARIGLLSGGLKAYWSQFPEMLPQIRESAAAIAERLKQLDVEVFDVGVVSDDHEGAAAAQCLAEANCDVVILFVATYMTSGQIIAVARECKIPMLLLELQPSARMEHATVDIGGFLRYAGVAALPELCNVLQRCHVQHDVIAGHLLDEPTWERVNAWVRAAAVIPALRQARHGMMGHLYPGMIDLSSSLPTLIRSFGGNVAILEVAELRALVEAVSVEDAEAALRRTREGLQSLPNVDQEHLAFQARVAVAMQQLVERHQLDTLAQFHFGLPGDIEERIAGSMAIGSTFLTTDGVPVGTEYDIRAVIAMLILERLGSRTMFTELYAVNYEDGVLEVGHDGPVNLAITGDSARLRPLPAFHGKSGSGNAIESSVRPGPVTHLAVAEMANGSIRLVVGEGQAVAGPVMSIGNSSTRIDFGCAPQKWAEAWALSGSAHHFAMGIGHFAREIRILARLLKLECLEISGPAL